MKTTCSKCNNPLEEHRVGKYRYCLKCHAEHMRKNRPSPSQYNPEQRMKFKARVKLNRLVHRGKIKRQNCKFCGSNENINAHHEDYIKPLDVIWLCRTCHLELHKNKEILQRSA